MKRKLLALLMTVTLLASFTACGEKNNETQNGESSVVEQTNEDYHFGAIADNSYNGHNYGITASFGEDWIIYSEREILEWNGYTGEDVVLEADIKAGDEFTELIAYSTTTYDSVMMHTKKLDESVDTKEIAAAGKTEYEDYYTSIEYTNVSASAATVDFLGAERDCVNMSAELDGEKTYLSVIYVELNNYLLTFEIASVDEAGVDAVLDSFKTK